MSTSSLSKKRTADSVDLKHLICEECHRPFEWPRKRRFDPECLAIRARQSSKRAAKETWNRWYKIHKDERRVKSEPPVRASRIIPGRTMYALAGIVELPTNKFLEVVQRQIKGEDLIRGTLRRA